MATRVELSVSWRPEKTIILAAGGTDLAEGKVLGDFMRESCSCGVTVLLEVSSSPTLLQNCTYTVEQSVVCTVDFASAWSE